MAKPAVRRSRLDAELVRRNLARSRQHAQELIAAAEVYVDGQCATKAATAVGLDAAIVIKPTSDEPQWASRGAHKLLGALAAFEPIGLRVAGKRALDAGASTGGFTDVLLSRGVREVLAVDVGYGQLVWRLQNHEQVKVIDRTNVRNLTQQITDGPVDLVVSDLSFISLKLVLPALAEVAADTADLVLMVKPQFEVGRDHLGKNGVVRDPQLRAAAVADVAQAALAHGLGTVGVTASPLPGPSGNVEYFVWLRRKKSGSDETMEPVFDPGKIAELANAAVEAGPQ